VDVYVQINEKTYAVIPDGVVTATKIHTGGGSEWIKWQVEIESESGEGVTYHDVPEAELVRLWAEYLEE